MSPVLLRRRSRVRPGTFDKTLGESDIHDMILAGRTASEIFAETESCERTPSPDRVDRGTPMDMTTADAAVPAAAAGQANLGKAVTAATGDT